MFPWLFVPLRIFAYRPLLRLWPGFDRNRYIRKLVAAANAWFADRFRRVPYDDRVLFLPYCLRPRECPARITADNGLDCDGGCAGCRLGALKKEAEGLGYKAVYVVVSGRIHRDTGVLRSRDFIMEKIRRHQPGAILVAVCSMDLERKYLSLRNLSSRGLFPAEREKKSLVPQGVLLVKPDCRQSRVDWDELTALLRVVDADAP